MALAVGCTIASAVAAPVARGGGTVVFRDVPVAPASYPDYRPTRFALKAKRTVAPQAFTYGNRADESALIGWYQGRFPATGWHVREVRRNNPVRGMSSIIADRTGEAVTIIFEQLSNKTTRVNIIKLVSRT
ncbi:MAG: hypothetical protein GIW98_05735 [Candidatus Eremiobacteraeota bacterium]|nr:hypothetical protein [Candidatus Eremiobacteraeota bacterium]